MRRLALLLCCCSCWLSCMVARAETLTGVVLTEEGEPAAGAAITAAAIFRSPPVRLTTQTDQQGGFEIELPKVDDPVRYALAVRWQGQGVDLVEAVDANGKSVDISGQKLPSQIVRLRTGGRLSGKLLRAEDDGPIAEAKLFLDTGEVLTTNEQGEFVAQGLPMKDHSFIPVAPGRIRQYVLFDTTLRPDAELEIRLPRGAIIKGHILDDHDQPIPGAYLTRASSGTALTLNGWDETCQADGSFEYGGLSTQRLFYSLVADAPGYRREEISSNVNAVTDVIERNVRLSRESPSLASVASALTAVTSVAEKPESPTTKLPRRTITGTVTDDAGQPVARASVRWGTFQWNPTAASTKTDADGKYVLVDAPGEAGAILAIADRFAPQFAAARVPDDRVDFRLSPGQSVRGVVRGTSGEPVADAQVLTLVRCSETGFCNSIWLDERSTRTNEKGEFELIGVPAAASFDILKQGYSDRRNVNLESGTKVNEVQLTAGGALRGQVVDSAGKPVRNFKIRVMIPRVYSPKEDVGGYYAGFDWYGVSFTRDDGVFVMTDLGANTWLRLIVTAPGIGLAVLDRAKSDSLDRLSPPEKLTIQLKPFAPLRVTVVDESSKQPVAGAQVTLLEDLPSSSKSFGWGSDDLWAERTHTGQDGTAEFAEPACEDGTLLIQAPGFARQRIGAVTTDRPWNVSLQPAAVINGEVRLNGKLLTEGFVRLTFAALDSASVLLEDTGGRFEFDQLPAGDYELTILNYGGQSLQTQKFKLESGQTRTENVTVSPPSGSKTEA